MEPDAVYAVGGRGHLATRYTDRSDRLPMRPVVQTVNRRESTVYAVGDVTATNRQNRKSQTGSKSLGPRKSLARSRNCLPNAAASHTDWLRFLKLGSKNWRFPYSHE
jgi:hypothetical protein